MKREKKTLFHSHLCNSSPHDQEILIVYAVTPLVWLVNGISWCKGKIFIKKLEHWNMALVLTFQWLMTCHLGVLAAQVITNGGVKDWWPQVHQWLVTTGVVMCIQYTFSFLPSGSIKHSGNDYLIYLSLIFLLLIYCPYGCLWLSNFL